MVDVIKETLLSWQVIACAVGVVLYWQLVSLAANPPRVKKTAAKQKNARLKRPKEEKPALDKDTDTTDLDLGK